MAGPPTILSSVLVRALSHPTRVRAMAVLWERNATPAEISAELGEPLSNLGYHLDVLEKLDCIELVEVRDAHGGRVVEHLYRCTKRGYVDAEQWKRFGEKEKIQLTMTVMQLSSDDVSEAVLSQTFFDPDDNHLSRTPMTVDRQGWEEAGEVLKDTLERLFEIEQKASARIADDDVETMPMKVLIFQFRSPRKY